MLGATAVRACVRVCGCVQARTRRGGGESAFRGRVELQWFRSRVARSGRNVARRQLKAGNGPECSWRNAGVAAGWVAAQARGAFLRLRQKWQVIISTCCARLSSPAQTRNTARWAVLPARLLRQLLMDA